MPSRTPPLGDLELAVMKAVWDRRDATVAEILEALRTGKRLHYNTVMTVMNRLVRKGYLERSPRAGRVFGYRPRISREAVARGYLRSVSRDFFGGSASGLVAAFLGLEKPSSGELSRLRGLLKRIEKGGAE